MKALLVMKAEFREERVFYPEEFLYTSATKYPTPEIYDILAYRLFAPVERARRIRARAT